MAYFLPLMRLLADGKPVSREQLATALGRPAASVTEALRQCEDLVYDEEDRVVSAGISLQPTPYHFEVNGHLLYTWCAFDTVLLSPQLDVEAQVQSTCPVTDQPITFVATSEVVIRDLSPASSVMSLIVPAQHSDCTRATFCQQSLLFQSEQAASTFLADHPEALLLSVEEAAYVGRLVAQRCAKDAG